MYLNASQRATEEMVFIARKSAHRLIMCLEAAGQLQAPNAPDIYHVVRGATEQPVATIQ